MSDTQLVKTLVTKEFGITDEDEHIVEGYVTDDLIDIDGHIIDADGFRAALVDYLKWANVRDQHGLPVGKVLDIPEWNKFVVQIVDDSVWKKVKAGLYKGFSVGIRVMDFEVEDAANYSNEYYAGLPPIVADAIKMGGLIFRITKMVLAEVSIVDRPANPRALITAHKNFNVDKESNYLPVMRPVIEAQERYEGEITMAKKNVSTEKTVTDEATVVDAEVIDATVAPEAEVIENKTVEAEVVDEVVAESADVQEDASEDKFASLEKTINEFVAQMDTVIKQITEDFTKQISDVTEKVATLHEQVNKSIDAPAEEGSITISSEENVGLSVTAPTATLNVESKSFDMDEMLSKITTQIEASVAAAVEKGLKAVESTERVGGINMGEGAEIAQPDTPVVKKKATYADAALKLAQMLNVQTAAN